MGLSLLHRVTCSFITKRMATVFYYTSTYAYDGAAENSPGQIDCRHLFERCSVRASANHLLQETTGPLENWYYVSDANPHLNVPDTFLSGKRGPTVSGIHQDSFKGEGVAH